MNQYLYQLKLVPRLCNRDAWTLEDEAIVSEHFMRLKHLKDQGIVLLAGKTNREMEDGFGIVIFKAQDLNSAQTIMHEDPAITGGVMTATLFDYHIALESLSKKQDQG